MLGMNAHNTTHAELLHKFYQAYSLGDVPAMLACCADDVTFQVMGKSPLAGKFDRRTFASNLLQRMRELSAGTHQMEVHDILASDLHGMVLVTHKLRRNGTPHEYRAAHVWRIQGAKLVAWYEYARDLYQFDAIWS